MPSAFLLVPLLGSGCTTTTRAADSSSAPTPVATHYVLQGGTVVGVGLADVEVDEGRIVAVGDTAPGAATVDVTGRFLAPAFIDSHVHLAYLREAEALAAGGIAGAVDLASPIAFLSEPVPALSLVRSGPMVTAVGGYPTQSWGRNGYGYEVSDAATASAAVDALVDAGAGVIKLPVTGAPALSPDVLTAAVERAHARGVKVASHALSDEEVSTAAAAGVDVLAHTPTGTLSESTLAAWKGRAVISTLHAFGGEANLAALRAHGAAILYGTDFGNTRAMGIDGEEIAALLETGLDGAAILAAGTTTPATYWGFTDLGAIAPGKRAAILVLDADPTVDPTTLGRVVGVVR